METNREYWNKKIVDIALGGDNVAIVNDEPVVCDNEKCSKCEICAGGFMTCDIKQLEQWGDEPYIPKPLLKGKEAELIRCVVEHSSFNVKNIVRVSYNVDNDDTRLLFEDGCDTSRLYVKPGEFSRMNIWERYTVKELVGGDEELIGHQGQ